MLVVLVLEQTKIDFQVMHNTIQRYAGVLLSVIVCLSLSACVTRPHVITQSEIDKRASADFAAMFSDSVPEGGTITLSEAIARSIKYNLDNRLKRMESVIAQKNLDLSDLNKLPQLALDAGYTERNRRQASSSLNLGTGVPNFGASTSQDKGILNADLTASWDALDFGIAYIDAKQSANEVLIAAERQRRMTQNVIKDVRYAYWRMLGTTRLQNALTPLLREIKQGLNDSYAAQQAKLKPIEECLEYQRAMLDIQRQMLTLQREINAARVELTAMMGLPPGTKFKVDGSRASTAPYRTDEVFDAAGLQQLALRNRPELIEEDYKARIAVDEIKKARLKLVPGLELFTGVNHNDNSFLLYDVWSATGYRLTWNLLNIFSGKKAISIAKSSQELGNIRRMALSMAVLTQVEIAMHKLKQSKEDYSIARQMNRVDSSLYEQYVNKRNASQMDHLSVVEAKARNLISMLRHSMAYAEWQNSVGQLYTSIGYQPAAVLNYNENLEVLTEQVKAYLNAPAFSEKNGFYVPVNAAQIQRKSAAVAAR